MSTPIPAAPTETPIGRIFTATAIIGAPGSGKTSQLENFALYIWETYKLIVLVYSWDGGAIPTGVQKRMKQGLIRYWRVRTRSADGLGLEGLMLASKGYWPRLINPRTGETSPAVALVGPLTTTYATFCPAGHHLKTVPSVALVGPVYCGPCKTLFQPTQQRMVETTARTKGFEQVGAVAYDGLTSMAQVVMEHMDMERGHGRVGGEKSSFGGVVTSGSIKAGGNNRADVGFAQSRAQQFVNNSLTIPYLVEGPIFTALTKEATDEGNLPIVGMNLPGSAATDQASAWFGNVFEMGKRRDDRGKEHFTMFLRPFTDPEGRKHLLKTSASAEGIPSSLPPFYEDPAIGEGIAFSVANLGNVFRTLDNDLREALKEEIPGAPGIPEGMMEYGVAATVEVGAAVPEPTATVAAPAVLSGTTAPAAAPGRRIAAPAPRAAAPKPKVATAPATTPAVPTPSEPGPVVTGIPDATDPASSPSATVAVSTPAASVPQVTPVTAVPAVAAVAAPTGTRPAPPPGMRPPARAPQPKP